ncbi:MAG: L-glutamate gamma-semialdehyde dehydrogenase [Bacteroidales bacterium]|jgi:1-pyrroline-5-carboxylate dehydrogenase|nr:L-glutamate gamma-semialdehyde dehydrogenase [Bacteroidales bacterium]
MNNAVFSFGQPQNEPVLSYLPGSDERKFLEEELDLQSNNVIDIPLVIGGKEIRTGKTGRIVNPCDHGHLLANYHMATENEVSMAINAALEAREEWLELPWIDRAAIMSKAAELISKKYRYRLNAATMLGQGKNAHQAEIDSACELIDFLRFNNYFASLIFRGQPLSEDHSMNRIEYRPLEGFVYAITPFNFTAIASNLNNSAVLMGNTTVWKPASTSVLSNYYLMEVMKEAGLPDGVINFVPGSGPLISSVVFGHRDLAGMHFTGSGNTFSRLWKQISDNLSVYRSFPRIVGETGGKNFIVAHASADPPALATAVVRGAFEYQGQKCSAASRAYIPRSLWEETSEHILKMVSGIMIGDVTDLNNFVNAVIDEEAFDKIMSYVDMARVSGEVKILTGGSGDKSKGYFIEPTIILTENPHFITMEEEIFGPVVTVFIYEDEKYDETLKLCDETSPYGLTGSIISRDRYAIAKACRALRYSAGNFYINDKPTGALVGQQPFGGSRASGTNDKAGSLINLTRWVSPRAIKETFIPPACFRYPYMD